MVSSKKLSIGYHRCRERVGSVFFENTANGGTEGPVVERVSVAQPTT